MGMDIPLEADPNAGITLTYEEFVDGIARMQQVEFPTTRDPKDAKALFSQFVSTALSNPNPATWEYLLFEDHPTIAHLHQYYG